MEGWEPGRRCQRSEVLSSSRQDKSLLHTAPFALLLAPKRAVKRSEHPLLPAVSFALSARQDPPLTSSQIPSAELDGSTEDEILNCGCALFPLFYPTMNIRVLSISSSLSGYYGALNVYYWTTDNDL